MEVYFRKTLDGNIQGSCEENPYKIVFISGYRPENKNSWRGSLPADKEVWLCELVRDTQPETKRRGALLVRLVKRLQKEFFLVEEASEFEGLPYLKVRAKVGSQEIDFVGTEVPETIKSRVSARIAEIENAKAALVAQCRQEVSPYTNGVFTLSDGVGGYSMLTVSRESCEIIQKFIIGSKNVETRHPIPSCFKVEYDGSLSISDLAEAEKLFGEAKVRDYLNIYWKVTFPAFTMEVKVENPPEDEVVYFFRPSKDGRCIEEVRNWADVEVSSTVAYGERMEGKNYYPASIYSRKVFQDEKAMELLRATIVPFETRLENIIMAVFDSNLPEITRSICSVWNITAEGYTSAMVTFRDVEEWYPESDDGYRSAGSCWVRHTYDTLWVGERSWSKDQRCGQERIAKVGPLRAFFLEEEKKNIEEGLKKLHNEIEAAYAEAVEVRCGANKDIYGDVLPVFKMPSMVAEIFERIQECVDLALARIPDCLERDKEENVRGRINALKEILRAAASETVILENRARNLRLYHEGYFSPSIVKDGEIESNPWEVETELLKDVHHYEAYKRQKLEKIRSAEQEKAEREAKMLEGNLTAKGEVREDSIEWYDLAIQEAYQLVKGLPRDYVSDMLLEALGYGAKRRLEVFYRLFNGANIRLTNPIYNNEQTRRIANGVREMVLANCPSVSVVEPTPPAVPASLDMLKAKFGKKR